MVGDRPRCGKGPGRGSNETEKVVVVVVFLEEEVADVEEIYRKFLVRIRRGYVLDNKNHNLYFSSLWVWFGWSLYNSVTSEI